MALESRHLIIVAATPTVADPEIETDVTDEKQVDDSGPRIRCPICGWVPKKTDLWWCTCRHVWNTFDTGGVCPACLHRWTLVTHTIPGSTPAEMPGYLHAQRPPRGRLRCVLGMLSSLEVKVLCPT